MKYFFGLVLLLAAGVVLCAGFYGFQRALIQMDLQTKLASCNTLVPENEEEKQLKEQIDALLAEEREKFKLAAKTSTTHKEFQRKCDELLLKWAKEEKLEKIIQAHNARISQKAGPVASF